MARLFRASAMDYFRCTCLHFLSDLNFCKCRSLSRLAAPVATDGIIRRSTCRSTGHLGFSSRKSVCKSSRYFPLPSRLLWVTSVWETGIHTRSPGCFAERTVQVSHYSIGVDSKPKAAEERGEESTYQSFKRVSKEHGKVLVAVHLATSVMCGVDVIPLMEKMGIGDTMINIFQSGTLGEYALAYLGYRVAAPLRYAFTLLCANAIIRCQRGKRKISPDTQKDDSLEFLRQKRKIANKLTKQISKINGR